MRPFLLIALTGLLLTNCVGTYRQITPITGEVGRFDGKAVTRVASPDSLVLVASFAREDFQYSAFDLELKNHSNHPVQIDPTRFTIRPLGPDQRLLLAPGTTDSIGFRGADPGWQAQQLTHDRDREVARLKRAKVINTILLGAVIVGGIVASSNTNHRSYESWNNARVNFDLAYTAVQTKRIIDHTTFANRMQRVDYEAYRWDKLALKPTLLQPGESIRGLVFLPKLYRADYLDLTYPTTDTDQIGVLFRQELVKGRR
jgi:hypothetical protein